MYLHTSPMDISEETPSSSTTAVDGGGGGGGGGNGRRRRTCSDGCGRPINVCLCHTLPPAPIPTATQIVILHHPHERRHKLATVPVLARCLRSCEVIVGRKLKYGRSELLDSLHDRAGENPNSPLRRAVYLFPGPDALPFSEVRQIYPPLDDTTEEGLVLIVFDGTWKHAKEMVVASLPFLSKFAVQVCLDFEAAKDGGTIFDSELILRKEPYAGCMSTMEAVARCLRLLETNGDDIESRILEVLRAMVSFQASYMKPLRPRTNLVKDNGKESLFQ